MGECQVGWLPACTAAVRVGRGRGATYLGAESGTLLAEVLAKIPAQDALGKPREVLDLGGGGQLR